MSRLMDWRTSFVLTLLFLSLAATSCKHAPNSNVKDDPSTVIAPTASAQAVIDLLAIEDPAVIAKINRYAPKKRTYQEQSEVIATYLKWTEPSLLAARVYKAASTFF